MTLRTVSAEKYLTPLREGGSLPAVFEADDEVQYVVKLVGAGHGHRALVAEVIVGELARTLGLAVPELVLVELDPVLGRSEPDAEIRDLLRASGGLNVGVRYLPGALAYEPALAPPPDPEEASRILWLDAFATNIDRAVQNPNLLVWRRSLWLIDHGSALYFHHNWSRYLQRAEDPFPAIRRHVLLPLADGIADAGRASAAVLGEHVFESVVASIPDVWLGDVPELGGPDEHRRAYVAYLCRRLASAARFEEEAERARADVV